MVKLSWTKLEPKADPKYGIPCARSSHGVSIVQKGTRLILHGGEHIARTPLSSHDATWIADLTTTDDAVEEWQWRCLDDQMKVVPPERLAHAQAVYNDSIVYIFGGRAGIGMDELPMNDMWKLDVSGPSSGSSTEPQWTLVEPSNTTSNSDPPPEPRSFHRMVCVGTNLYVFGGCGVNGRLADLHKFDVLTNTWHNLGTSSLLRGRGGANLLTLSSGSLLAVVAGFAGEETADGHLFDVKTQQWFSDGMTEELLQDLRPRSVCVSGSFPSVGYAVIFGGEVDPSQKGHEGAGDFANDVVVLDETTGKLLETVPPSTTEPWPVTRGWSDAASYDAVGDGVESVGHLYFFGGLTGNDANPERLDDLWRLNVRR